MMRITVCSLAVPTALASSQRKRMEKKGRDKGGREGKAREENGRGGERRETNQKTED